MSNDFLKSMILLGSLSSDSKAKKEIKRENKIKNQIIENNKKIISLNNEIIRNTDELASGNKELIDSQAKTIDYLQEAIDSYINLVKIIGENINEGIDLLESTKLHFDALINREKFLKSLKNLVDVFPSISSESLNEYIEELNNHALIYNEFIKEIEEYNAKVINEKKDEK